MNLRSQRRQMTRCGFASMKNGFFSDMAPIVPPPGSPANHSPGHMTEL
jgi:hypothetical protein